ncbi:ethylene receptor 2-like [Vigna umbellata]|uniref:ethylene receptor 2-like n=1 Tax=Vigna umbellata TaxID=87088 RepID=UPI001F5FB1E6|nr:ethylene receptor 2-like [Vigna umbellata]XP_047148667.1 ethylene receptor 2-like [Vigna umbellata]XP_047148668.1 ethylene receptor 2-like [Vigna umbellata]XP_047148669.1 ethylene receptor 2-like [Vigna umbellata]
MLKSVSFGLLLTWFVVVTCVYGTDVQRCNCDDEWSFWTIDTILECQRVGDFLIAVAYFSIPVELLYFVSCSNLPFKWVLFEFIAFIVLCGMTHLLNGWTYGPHTFQLMVAITVFKTLTALVSCATALTLLTLIPLLLKVKVREFMLKKKTWDLGREVGFIMKQKEASVHVRMLTQEIRKSLDRHKILYTTLVELSKTLGLQNCAIWMPNDEKTEMNLTHELNGRNANCSILITDPDVARIKGSDEVNVIDSDSVLATASSGDSGVAGPVAAIRMPMLRVSNFKGGTPELRQTCYAVLVLILPVTEAKSWSTQELEIIKVVADQVAVALSHAAILEESHMMRGKLEEQNRALQVEKINAMRANQARAAFQKVMSNGMGRPMHSILGLLSVMQEENLKREQKLVVDSMFRTSTVMSNLLNDAMDWSSRDDGRFPLEMKPFGLHAMVKDAACFARFMCVYSGLGFVVDADKSLPDNVIGEEKRVFQVLLHMVGSAINCNRGGGVLVLRVYAETGSQGRSDQGWTNWRPSSSNGDVNIRFEIGIKTGDSEMDNPVPSGHLPGTMRATDTVEQRLSFSICKRIIQLMQGNIWFVPNGEGDPQVMAISLRFQVQRSVAVSMSETGESSEASNSNSFFRGLQVLLVENDDVNRAVTQKLLQKLGCCVTCVCSGIECLSVIGAGGCSFQVIVLDVHMPELDGFEVASRLRKFGSRNWPVIVALTASTEDFWEKCMQVGINGVIRKPLLLHGIAAELRRILLQGNTVM